MPFFTPTRRAVLLGLSASALAGPGRAALPPETQRIPIELYEEALELDGAIQVGARRGDVTMVEFFDYNCGYCRRSALELQALLDGDPDLSYVLVNYPVLGAASVEAARVALAVYDRSGPQRALALHGRLFSLRGALNGPRVLETVRDLGMDAKDFAASANVGKVDRWMAENLRVGRSLGLMATPSFLVGPEAVVGSLSLEQKRALIARARA